MEQIASFNEVAVGRIVAPNPGPKTLEGTNTYLVLGRHGYLIDPGPDLPAHVEAIIRAITRFEPTSISILLTHCHPDHAEAAAKVSGRLDAPVLAAPHDPDSPWPAVHTDRRLQDGDCLPLDENARLQVVGTPGHTADHLAFLLSPAAILFAGDLVLGRGSTLIAPPEGDVITYLASLRLLDAMNLSMLAPGHGPLVTDPSAKIAEDINHRRQREHAILSALAAPLSIDEIVHAVYTDVSASLLPLARQSVHAQLLKLLRDGAIVETAGRYSRATR